MRHARSRLPVEWRAGANRNNLMLERVYTMDYETTRTFLNQLDRIATALEVIARDITDRKARETESLRSQLDHLEREAWRAGELFSAADRALESRGASDGQREYARQCEQAMLEAQRKLDAFRAAHPELAALEAIAA